MISIIIPVKNHRVVKKLLDSLNNVLTPESLEIIIVDASNGGLSDIQQAFSNVRWLNFNTQKKFSVADQRNYGILMAKGDILVFIDADCIPKKNWIYELVKPIREDGESIAASKIISMRKFPSLWDWNYRRIESHKYISFAATMGTAFNKNVFCKIGGYDSSFNFGGEDTDLCIRALNAGFKILYAKNACIYHDWGTINRNIYRAYVYGKAHYKIFLKYPKKTILETISYLFYFFCLLFIPITLIINYYILILLFIFILKAIEVKSISYAYQIVIYKFLKGFGFLVESLSLSKLIKR